MRIPLGEGIIVRTSDTWPRTKALYCHPVGGEEWPADPEIVEAVPLKTCVRRGAAVDVVADRARENRSQLVYTVARGRQMIFWQSPRTRKQARPQVAAPKARASGLPDVEIIVDSRERYAYKFAAKPVTVVRSALPCGDYGVRWDGSVVAAVERKSLDDLITSVSSGRLRFALGQLAGLPRAAVVVEDRYSGIFKQRHVRPAVVADALAELQVRWPTVAIVFCESRPLAEEWTYRYLAAAYVWASQESAAAERIGVEFDGFHVSPESSESSGSSGSSESSGSPASAGSGSSEVRVGVDRVV